MRRLSICSLGIALQCVSVSSAHANGGGMLIPGEMFGGMFLGFAAAPAVLGSYALADVKFDGMLVMKPFPGNPVTSRLR